MVEVECDCGAAMCHWTAWASAGVCAGCSCVFLVSDRSSGRRGIDVFDVGVYLDTCRINDRFPIGGEA